MVDYLFVTFSPAPGATGRNDASLRHGRQAADAIVAPRRVGGVVLKDHTATGHVTGARGVDGDAEGEGRRPVGAGTGAVEALNKIGFTSGLKVGQSW